jgi:His/Glu/Gln/Arg/opine family amino acid ABC transporter permease subunit
MSAFLFVLERNWMFLLRALGMTLAVSGLSLLLGFALGVAVALGRTYGGRAADLVLGFYVDTMRSVPVLVVLVWSYFALPLLTGHAITPFVAAVGALGIHLAAYVAETVRAGLTSVRAGQMRAALALGMSPWQAIRKIILPQALVRMLPPLGSLGVIAIKDSAVSSVIAVPELIRQTQVLVSNTYLSFQLYTFTMLVFFLISYPLARLVDRLHARIAYLGAS